LLYQTVLGLARIDPKAMLAVLVNESE